MILPGDIKDKIAEKLVKRIALPFYAICIAFWIGILLFYPDQYLRIIPSLPPFFCMVVSWFLVRKAMFRLSRIFLVAGIISFIITTMITSGGIEAPGFMGVIACLILVACFYGFRGAAIFAVSMLILGAISIKLITLGLIPGPPDLPSSYWVFHFGLWFPLTILFISAPLDLLVQALKDSQKTIIEKEVKEK